jgi:hypothetical protein
LAAALTKPAPVHCRTLQIAAESKAAAEGRLSGERKEPVIFARPTLLA